MEQFDVPQLPKNKASEALDRGGNTAREFIEGGMIEAAYLSLQNQRLVIQK